MLSTNRDSKVKFHNKDLYETLSIPLRQFYLEQELRLDDALVLNQMVFSNKEVMTLNQIKKLSLYEKGKPALRKALNRLADSGFISINKKAGRIFNQVEYSVTEKATGHNPTITGLVEGKDLKESGHYLKALIVNKFRTYLNSGIESVHISANELAGTLGNVYSESSVRLALRDLVDNDYLSAELVLGVYNYDINKDKFNCVLTPEELENKSNILLKVYLSYLNKINIPTNEDDHKSFSLTFKRMLENGYDFTILKHILVYVRKSYKDYSEYLTLSNLKSSFEKLKKLALAVSKRKLQRLLFKILNNIPFDDIDAEEIISTVKEELSEEFQGELEELDDIVPNVIDEYQIWNKAIAFIESINELLKKNYYHSIAGVTDMEFDDYKQQALCFAFEYFSDPENNEDNKHLSSIILYRLKDFMYNKRHIQKNSDNENIIINFENEFENIDFTFYNQDFNEIEYTEDEIYNQGIESILSCLPSEKDRTIVKYYIGYDGETLTFKEIGERIGHTESYTARRFKKAILLLKEELGDNIKIIEDIITNKRKIKF